MSPPATGFFRVLAIAILLLGSLLSARGESVESPIVHHRLSVELQPEYGRLVAEDVLRFRPDSEALWLRLHPESRVEEVLSHGGAPLLFTFKEGILDIVQLPPRRNGKAEIVVKYRTVFNDVPPAKPLNADDPTFGVQGSISEKGAFLLPSAEWYPRKEGARETFDLTVKTPPGFHAVTQGKREELTEGDEAWTSRWKVVVPAEGLALSAGPYVIGEIQGGEVPVYTYFYAPNESLAPPYLSAAAGYLQLYTDLVGPYPFEKFAIVENFFPTGYGFPSYTLLGSAVIRLPFIIETSLGHEIAHCWWGNGVLVDHREGNWAEGLTAYLADHLYKERSSPEEGRQYRLELLRNYTSLVTPPDKLPLSRFQGRASPAEQAVGYGKGAMVFHMLRQRVGDDAFWKALQSLYSQKLFEKAAWSDFALFLEKQSSESLVGFFSQWVDRPGAPVLRLERVQARRDGSRWKISAVVAQEPPFYRLRLPVLLETSGEPVEEVVMATGEKTAFTLEARNRPLKLRLDPRTDVFRRLAPEEIPPAVNDMRRDSPPLVVMGPDLSPGLKRAAALLPVTLGQQGAQSISPEELAEGLPEDRDLLFLGLPRDPSVLPPLPQQLALSPREFTLQGNRYGDPGDALFVVMRHPRAPDKSVALFHPLSEQAASTTIRKIPHYGKYSFLVFRNGRIHRKGVWPVSRSPVIHVFPKEEPSP